MMSRMLPSFPKETLSFLRALKRNNNREWFRSRKDDYERVVRTPMIAVIEQLAKDFRRIAPEVVASPKASLYRIYRDTRFSEDKTPLKTNAAAVFPWKGLARHEGAGLYFEIAPGWVWIGGGMYAPQPPQLVKVREHIVDTWPAIRRSLARKTFVSRVTTLHGEKLTRVPRGFPGDHPAVEFLKHRQFLASREFPPELATTARVLPDASRDVCRDRSAGPVPECASLQHSSGSLASRSLPARWRRTRCSAPQPSAPPRTESPRHLVLVTIDTLRADRVGAYGYARARTPTIDGLARPRRQIRPRVRHSANHAAVACVAHDRPISAGPRRAPQRHARRQQRADPGKNAVGGRFCHRRVRDRVSPRQALRPECRVRCVQRSPSAHGAAAGERAARPGSGQRGRRVAGDGTLVIQAPLRLVASLRAARAVWRPGSQRPVADRYDDEVAESDAQIARLVAALGPEAASSVIVIASDHGEAFGEHGEVTHSLFVYDTTLRVPLVITGPGVTARTIDGPISLVDVAPTVLPLLGLPGFDADGINLSPAISGGALPTRDLYAESFAPLLDFGWAPLRSLRAGAVKYIDAPRAELYDTQSDPGEERNLTASQGARVAELRDRVARYSDAKIDASKLSTEDREARGAAAGARIRIRQRRIDGRPTSRSEGSTCDCGAVVGGDVRRAQRSSARERAAASPRPGSEQSAGQSASRLRAPRVESLSGGDAILRASYSGANAVR